MDPKQVAMLPRFQSHKIVRASKIVAIEGIVGEKAYLILETEGIPPVEVDVEWQRSHKPTRGGDFVVYSDDYTSFSPAEPFESGYTLIR